VSRPGDINLGVITPVKNEGANLKRLAKNVLSQTRPPDLWVIVDDGSIDETPQIIAGLEKRHDFIKGLSLQTKGFSYDPIFRYGIVVRLGMEQALRMCADLHFLGVLDADIVLKKDYYEKVLLAFGSYQRLGIASGLYLVQERGPPLKILGNICGGAMVFRRECLNEIGGFPVSPSPDTVAMIKAINRGWHLGVISSVYALHMRVNTSWTKFIKLGLSRYILGLHPLSALFTGPLQAIKDLSLKPLGFTIGYLVGMMRPAQKISDNEVNQYFYERFKRSVYRRIGKLAISKKIYLDPIQRALVKL